MSVTSGRVACDGIKGGMPECLHNHLRKNYTVLVFSNAIYDVAVMSAFACASRLNAVIYNEVSGAMTRSDAAQATHGKKTPLRFSSRLTPGQSMM